MASFIKNKLNGAGMNNNNNNFYDQLQMVKRDSGAILDILLQNEKINNQQYMELQPYRNNPAMIVNYLMNHGYADQINAMANRMNGNGEVNT